MLSLGGYVAFLYGSSEDAVEALIAEIIASVSYPPNETMSSPGLSKVRK